MSGLFVLIVSIFALLSWILDIPMFRSVMPESFSMRFDSAVAFTLAGIALILVATEQGSRFGRRALPEALAVVVSLIGLVTPLVSIPELSTDQHLFLQSEPTSLSTAGRLPLSALAFLLFGPGFLLAQSKRYFPLFQIFAWLIFAIGWLACSPYFYGGAPLLPFAQISINAGVCLTLLAAGLLCLRPEKGLISLLQSDTGGGVVARRLVPAALICPVVLAWVRDHAQAAGWIGQAAGRSLLALANVLVFGTLTWISAARLRKSDLKNQQSHSLLTEWQQRLESALENGGIGTWVYDIKSNEGWLDEALTTLLGRSREDLDGGRPEIFFSFVHPEDMVATRSKFQSAVLGVGEYNTEYRYIKPDGTIIWLSTRARLERDKNGQPSRLIGACVDITRQKNTAETLQLQAILFDQSSEGLIVWEWDQGITYWNRGAESLYGFSKEEALGRSTHDLLRTKHSGGLDIFLNELQRKGSWVGELTHTTSDGRQLAIETRMLLFRQGEKAFVLEANRDITERQLANQRLQQAYEDLRQTQQAVVEQERLRVLGQMASGIAHDINNALSPVALYTDFLLGSSSSLDSRDRSYIEIISRAVDDVTATVARIREFYRHREPQMELTPVNLNAMAQQVIDLTRARWHDIPLQRGIVISMRTQLVENLPEVMGAENEIREALTNLIFNAVDAMPEGGVLIVRTHVREDFDSIHNHRIQHVAIEVTDTGVGMDELTRQRCLEPFFTTKGERGTGLGLGMVYGVVQRHSGSMEIDSEVGKGTTVRLIFAPAAENVPRRIILSPPKLPGMRLLVIDDDPLLIQSLVDTLAAEGHQVVSASGGEAGIEAFNSALERKQKFEVVFTDLGMPFIDGSQVATAIKQASPETPVILLTGWGQRMLSNGEVPEHVDLVLSKPPKLRDLREALLEVTKVV